MKRRFLSLILTLALILTMIVVPAAATEEQTNVTATTETCPCGCGKVLDEITWNPWNVNVEGDPNDGHYYLDGDYIQDGQIEIMASNRVTLDLRGYTITSKSYSRLAMVYGNFYLLDTLGGGRFMSKTSGKATGGVVAVSTNEVNDSLFQLCSGTITVDSDNQGGVRGGLISLAETATFRMTGGMLLNGSSVSDVSPDRTDAGGNLASSSTRSTIEILGGQIIGGESAGSGGNIYSTGTVILKNCHIVGGTAAKSGGNVFVSGDLTVENCVIESGVAKQTDSTGGGNICIASGGTLSMKDSTVRNGWAHFNGGNIYLGTSSAVIENSVMEAGVAKNRGNNLYGYKSATNLTIRNCELPGDIAYTGAGLKLEGKVKIGLLNYGLRLHFGEDIAAPLDASGLAEGSEIYVNAKSTFTTPGANLAYFKGSNRVVLTESAEGLTGAYAAGGEMGGYCPHCNQQVVWTAFDTAGSLVQTCYKDAADGEDTDPACTGCHLETGHYYLTQSYTSFRQLYAGVQYDLNDIKDVVIDMSGYSITANSRAFYLRGKSDNAQQSSLTVLDSYGNSKITGSGTANQPGGVIYNEGANFIIYGATWIYKPVEGRNVTGGAVVLNGNSFRMYGGTLDASAFTYTDASTTEKTYTYNGGCLYQYNGEKYDFTMTAGRMIGGTVQSGGCAYFGTDNQVEITGGQFDSGKTLTGSGGNIRTSNAKLNMSGVAVRDGRIEATSTGGGNLALAYGTVNISDSYIEGGYSADYGGNIVTAYKADITFTDCIIEGGYAQDQGGNAQLTSTSTHTTWNRCQILNGSGSYGGNINSGNGYNTFSGCQILFGTARTSYGGNMAASAGNASETSPNYTIIKADDEGNAPLLAGGYAKTYGGNLYVGGVAQLLDGKLVHGKADISGLDLFVTKGSKQSHFTLGAGVTGEIWAQFNNDLYGEGVYGQPVDRTTCQTLNAKIIIDNYDNVPLCAKDGKLYMGAIAVHHADGTYTWYVDSASAVEACPADGHVKLFSPQDVVLTRDCAVDICGNSVNISGAYTLYGMDSSGDGFTTPTGKAILAPETKVAASTNNGGKQYFCQQDETGATFHRLENRISGVTLRPSAAGIYYTGSFGGDETMVENIASYGVAVSLKNMPGVDFMEDEDTKYTQFDAATLVAGAQQTGVLISGIMKEEGRNPRLNSAYGQMPIFATSYLVMKDGTVVLSDISADHTDDVAYSLHDVVKTVDENIVEDPLHWRIYTNPMRDFYSKWKDLGMGDWEFEKVIPPQEDDVIDILMIGNSFCSYYVQELAGIAAADGIKMRVCNVYYSGCRMDQHYNWWLEGKAPYQFYETWAGVERVGTNNVSLEWCLAQGEWDVITLQTARFITDDLQTEIDRNKPYMDTLVGYLREQFPKATLGWHQTWTYEIGTASNGTVTDAQSQKERHERILAHSLHVCEEYDLLRINTGDAWKILRDEGYRKLCARLGKGNNHEGDYYHDGDIGGGQYLNACVWYEWITGNSCLGNTYRPVYKYNGVEYPLNSEITYERLQEVAHQVVAEAKQQ